MRKVVDADIEPALLHDLVTLVSKELSQSFLEVGLESCILTNEFIHELRLFPIEACQMIIVHIKCLLFFLLELFGHFHVIPYLLLIFEAISVEAVVLLIWVEHEAEIYQ